MIKLARFCLLTLGAACSLALAAAPRPVLKIGVIAPLTGDNAMLGEDMKGGVTLALEELQGQLPFDLKAIFEDDQQQIRQTNLAARKLIDFDKVDVIFDIWTPSANLLGPLCDKARVIQFNSSWDATPCQKFSWTLMHGATYQDYVQKVIEIMKLHKAKRVAIAYNIELGNNMCVSYALPLIKQAGIEVVFHQNYSSDERDLRTFFLKLLETKPDFIWQHNNPPTDIIFLKAWAQLGDKIPSTGYFDFMRAEYKDYQRLYEGTVFGSSLYTTPAFTEKYMRRFGHPSNVRAGHFYDMTKIIAQAAKTQFQRLGRMPTHDELLAELKTPKEFPELAVGPGRMTSSGWVESHYVYRQIKDGKATDYTPSK